MKQQGRQNTRAGFTLVELLVVMSIIAVLAAILLPAIKTVRQLARSSVCSSGLRQLGMAAVQYANEWEGRFPPLCYADSGGAPNYDATPWKYNDDLIGKYTDDNYTMQSGAFAARVPSRLICPLRKIGQSPQQLLFLVYGINRSAPGYSGSVFSPYSAIAPRLGQVKGSVILFADALDWIIQGSAAGSWKPEMEQTNVTRTATIAYRHSGRTNAVFFDGSTHGMSVADLHPWTLSSYWK